MVVTKMRDSELMVKILYLQLLSFRNWRRSRWCLTYIGPPTQKYAAKLGTAPRLQLNDQFAPPEAIPEFIANEKKKVKNPKLLKMTALFMYTRK